MRTNRLSIEEQHKYRFLQCKTVHELRKLFDELEHEITRRIDLQVYCPDMGDYYETIMSVIDVDDVVTHAINLLVKENRYDRNRIFCALLTRITDEDEITDSVEKIKF